MSTEKDSNLFKEQKAYLEAKQNNANTILNSNQRLAELNDSHRKRYAKYVEILTTLILAYMFYLGVILLQKAIPTIPQFAVDAVTIILIFMIAFYLFRASWELYTRNNMNYDEIDVPMHDASGIDLSKLQDTGRVNDFGTATCTNDECCPANYKHDPVSNKCIESASFTTLETAYANVEFNSPSLKREPNAHDVQPLQDKSVLVYSNF